MGNKVVLFSGGWESTYCALKAGPDALLLFVDYGQHYRAAEFQAITTLSLHLPGELALHTVDPIRCWQGIYDERNETFIRMAVSNYSAKEIWIGSRAPLNMFDKYGDSNRQWAGAMERKYNIKIVTPLTLWPKWLVKWRTSRMLADRIIFSSEGL